MKVTQKRINLLGILAVFYGFTTLISFCRTAYFKHKQLNYTNLSWTELLVDTFLIDYLLIMIFVVISTKITRFLIKKKMTWSIIISTHIILSFLIGFFILYGGSYFRVMAGRQELIPIDTASQINNVVQFIDTYFLIYFSMVLITYTHKHIEKIRRIQQEKSAIESELINTKLNLLKSNLEPHFLFNTLNSISALVDIDKKQAQNTIADLSRLLRDLTHIGNKHLIPLEKELNILVGYINIIEVRFSDHFSFSADIDDELLQVEFPSLLLNTIIENSVKPGYDFEITNLEVHLSVEKEGDYMLVSISNNGKSLDPYFEISDTNVGISNTIERLKKTYKNDFQFAMKNKKDGQGVITHIRIPHQISATEKTDALQVAKAS